MAGHAAYVHIIVRTCLPIGYKAAQCDAKREHVSNSYLPCNESVSRFGPCAVEFFPPFLMRFEQVSHYLHSGTLKP